MVIFSLLEIEGLRRKDVACCTDGKAHRGNVIVIVGYTNNIDLIWFDLIWFDLIWFDLIYTAAKT